MAQVRQAYGSWCKLDPVVTIGGVDYGAAVRFQSWMAPRDASTFVVNGEVQSISGTTTKTIVCKRSLQSSSYTNDEGDDTPFTFLAGGNVCQTHEAQRHYWHNNTDGRLGGDAARRAMPGDLLWYNGKAFLITSATALDTAPASVAWQPGESSPGRAPVCTGTVNLATAASTTVSENRLHYSDKIVVDDPEEELGIAADETFAVYRNAMFDSRNPPTVEYDVRDGVSDWATLDPANYLARWPEGIILIRQSWITSEGWDTTPFCIRVEGVRFSQAGPMPARQLNDFAAAANSLDELWCEAPYTSAEGVVPAASGYSAMRFGATGWECDGVYGLQATGWGAGDSWAGWLAFGVVTGSGTVYPPYYAAGYWTEASEAFDDTSGTLGCDPGDDLTDENVVQPDKCVTNVKNEAAGGTVHGKDQWVRCTQTVSTFHTAMSADFSIEGIPLNPEGILKRIDDGSTIIEAVGRFKVSGLVRRQQDTEITGTGNSAPFQPYHLTTTVNGTVTREYEVDGSGSVVTDTTASEPSLAATAGITFALIGVTQDTDDVVDVNGTTVSGVPNHRIMSLGVGIRTTAGDDEWTLIDVTSAIQGLIDNRHNRITGFYWWPSTGHVAPGASFSAMGSFVVSLFGDWSASVSYDGSGVRTLGTSATTTEVGWDSLAIDSVHIRWRLPSGAIDSARFPLLQPPMMVAP